MQTPLGWRQSASKQRNRQIKSLTLDELKQIAEKIGMLEGWDFSRGRAQRAPVLWEYTEVVRQYLKPKDRVLDIGTGAARSSLRSHHSLAKGSVLTYEHRGLLIVQKLYEKFS